MRCSITLDAIKRNFGDGVLGRTLKQAMRRTKRTVGPGSFDSYQSGTPGVLRWRGIYVACAEALKTTIDVEDFGHLATPCQWDA